MNLSSPGLIKTGKLFTTTLISSLVMGMFRLLTSWFNFGGFAKSISYAFLLDFSEYRFLKHSLMIFRISLVIVIMFPCSFLVLSLSFA